MAAASLRSAHPSTLAPAVAHASLTVERLHAWHVSFVCYYLWLVAGLLVEGDAFLDLFVVSEERTDPVVNDVGRVSAGVPFAVGESGDGVFEVVYCVATVEGFTDSVSSFLELFASEFGVVFVPCFAPV